jgi:lipopolysaccharide biosynthesis glycosyltransferase
MNVPVVLAINDAYLRQAKVLIYSLYDNAGAKTEYTIYILNYQMSSTTRRHLTEFYASNGWKGDIRFLDLSAEQWAAIPLVGKWGKETNYRLFLPELLPQWDKVIYLDADIIVLGDLEAYYQLELGEHAFASVAEDVLPFRKATIFHQLALLDQHNVVYQDDFDYINAGVLLLNLAKLRQIEFTEKSLRLMALMPKDGFWVPEFSPCNMDPRIMPDQDILFYLAHAYTKGVMWTPTIYNYLPFMYNHRHEEALNSPSYQAFVNFLNRRVGRWASDSQHPVVIHFAACHPWKVLHSRGQYADRYVSYAHRTGWHLKSGRMRYFWVKLGDFVKHRFTVIDLPKKLRRVLR